MAGEDLDAVGQLQQPLVQRVVQDACALVPGDREVGPRGVADEEGVAGEREPRLVGARVVDDEEDRVLGPVPRRVPREELDVADADPAPVLERLVRVLGARQAMDVHGDAALQRERAVAGHVVRVRVRLEDGDEAGAVALEHLVELADVERRVDHDGLAGGLAADHVGRAAEVAMDELLEDHDIPTDIVDNASIRPAPAPR